jgi:hypothetical protein
MAKSSVMKALLLTIPVFITSFTIKLLVPSEPASFVFFFASVDIKLTTDNCHCVKNLIHVKMNFQYTSVSSESEKSPLYATFNTTDSLGDFEDHFIEQSEHGGYEIFGHVNQSYWIWLVHAVMFSTSITLFILSLGSQSSTLEHVRRFSAWCEYHSV